MAFTDEEVAQMGGDVAPPPVIAHAPRVKSAAPGKVTKQVPINLNPGEYEKAAATVDRLNQLARGLGVDTDEQGQVVLDNDKSRTITKGLDPEVAKHTLRRFATEMRKAGAEKPEGERSGIKKFFLGESDASDPYKEFRGGVFEAPQNKRIQEAQRTWSLIDQLIGHREEGRIGADPTTYLFSADASEGIKRDTRARLAQKIRQEARTLPSQLGGPEAAARFNTIADYIESQNPELLHGAHKSMQHVGDLASRHASEPVKAAVDEAIKEQSDPDRTSVLDALKTGFGNNAAPLTMAAGSLLTRAAPGVIEHGGQSTFVDPETGVTTELGATEPAKGSIGGDVDKMHQTIVQNLTGKSPEEQAAFIETLKAEHPIAYRLAAAGGWLADPVGLAGGKAFQGIKAGIKAAGGGLIARNAVPALVAGAPMGALAGRGAGSENDLLNAGVGAGGALAGEAVNAVAGAGAKALAGAPKRVAAEELAQEARAVAHELGQAAHRHGAAGEGTVWEQVYSALQKRYPQMKPGLPVRDASTGKFRPGYVPELAHAADVATVSTHGAGPGAAANAHPFMTLMNPQATPAQVAIAIGHEAVEGRTGRALTAAALGRGKAITNVGDKAMASIVSAIRKASPDEFRKAIMEARAAGMSAAAIDAAQELYQKRNKESAAAND